MAIGHCRNIRATTSVACSQFNTTSSKETVMVVVAAAA